MPSVTALVQDQSMGVRGALSDACMSLAPALGQAHTVRSVVPMLQHFLRDEASEVSARGENDAAKVISLLICGTCARAGAHSAVRGSHAAALPAAGQSV